MNQASRRELLLFTLLLTFGVIGRWLQPAWNFTPLAAVTAMGAYCFRSWLPAVLLPVSLLVISDVLLQPHDSWAAMLSVHAMAVVPLALGRLARGSEGWRRAACWGLCGFVPATAFFLVTNFAVWAGRSLYEPTFAGLMHCYEQAIPFYRTMLAGDVCYVALAVACLAVVEAFERRTATVAA